MFPQHAPFFQRITCGITSFTPSNSKRKIKIKVQLLYLESLYNFLTSLLVQWENIQSLRLHTHGNKKPLLISNQELNSKNTFTHQARVHAHCRLSPPTSSLWYANTFYFILQEYSMWVSSRVILICVSWNQCFLLQSFTLQVLPKTKGLPPSFVSQCQPRQYSPSFTRTGESTVNFYSWYYILSCSTHAFVLNLTGTWTNKSYFMQDKGWHSYLCWKWPTVYYQQKWSPSNRGPVKPH